MVKWSCRLGLTLTALALTASAFAADPPPGTPEPGDGPATPAQTVQQFRQELAKRRPGIVAELTSGDPDKVQKATDEIDEWSRSVNSSRRADLFEMFVDTGLYEAAEDRIVQALLKSPASNYAVEHLQKVRAKSLLKQGKAKEALSAAKAYYDVCRFSETKDAIALVATCLSAANPADPSLAKRFKAQQVAGAGPTTQPAADLGAPILASIPPEAPPVVPVADIDARAPTTFVGYEAKGNLLLLVGRAADAKAVFDKAYALATDAQKATAIENVARAIRAVHGSVGPANDYVTSVQQAK